MHTRARLVLNLTLVLLAAVTLVAVGQATTRDAIPVQGGAPSVVAYQGEVRLSGTPHSGGGHFKFAIVNAAGDTTYWSNDGTSTGGGDPTAAVPLAVGDGLFSVLLGDTSLAGMTQALTADVFRQPDRFLRVWFSTSAGGPFSRLTPDTRIAAVPYALQAQEAVNADMLDGLHASELGTHYQNVVVVAKDGGDYTSIQEAIDSIDDAAAENPYMVWVAPGLYGEQVTMKPFVHLQGAGQGLTLINSNASNTGWPPTEATLKLASETSLRGLTVVNEGMDTYSVVLLATLGTVHTLVTDVTVEAQGGGTFNYAIFVSGSGTGITLEEVTSLAIYASDYNYGLFNTSGGAVTLRGGSFTARGGTYPVGIVNQNGAQLEAENVAALAENGTEENRGLGNTNGAAATLRGGSFTGLEGKNALGIVNGDSGTKLDAEGVRALGMNGTEENYGLDNGGGATANVTHSVLEGFTNSVHRSDGSVTISHSRLVDGGVSGTVTCVGVSQDATFYANSCP